MSLILEALKKSEARRQLGNVPDLGTPFATAKPRRGLVPYIFIAIAIVGGIGVWMLHKPDAPVVSASTKTPPARHDSARTTAPGVSQHSTSGAPQQPRNGTNAAPHKAPIRVAAQRPEASLERRQNRQARRAARLANNASAPAHPPAPVMGQTHQPTTHAPAPIATPPKPATHPRSATPQTASQQVASGRPTPMANRRAAQATEQSVPAGTNTGRAAKATSITKTSTNQPDPTRMVAGPSAVPKKPALAVEPSTVPTNVAPYYQLAYAVRKALPPIKLSMHVYSADPAARFVILNDSRMTEGDKTPDEITLEKIVPDGVILEFDGHRFFYPRDAL